MKSNEEQRALGLLETLYELARGDIHATPEILADWTGLEPADVSTLLDRLDAQALVDRNTCRLTMTGLVLAVSRAGSRKVAKHAA